MTPLLHILERPLDYSLPATPSILAFRDISSHHAALPAPPFLRYDAREDATAVYRDSKLPIKLSSKCHRRDDERACPVAHAGDISKTKLKGVAVLNDTESSRKRFSRWAYIRSAPAPDIGDCAAPAYQRWAEMRDEHGISRRREMSFVPHRGRRHSASGVICILRRAP